MVFWFRWPELILSLLYAACFLLVVQATHQWKPPAVPAKLPNGELFRVFQDGDPLYSLRARLSGRVGPKFPVCPIHFSDSGVDVGCGLSSSNLGLLFTSMGAGPVFMIPRLRASLRQLKAAVEYGQVIPNIRQMGRFFSSMSGALQIATEGRAYHRWLLYA